jgi:dihydropteroate synthase
VADGEDAAKVTIRRSGFNVFPLELRREERAPYLEALGVSREGVPHLARRMGALCLRAEGLDARGASILKQDMLSVGGDVALPDTVSRFIQDPVTALLMGTRREFGYLVKGLKAQPYGLKGLSAEIEACLRAMERPGALVVRGEDLLRCRPFLLMGVVNVTPDSFADGGRYLDAGTAVEHGKRLAEQGAHILDVGAESSRPGSEPVPEEEERRRLLPVVEGLRRALPEIVLSVDTTKASVAAAALDAGADLVNDISAGADPAMFPLCAGRSAPIVLMHMRGEPKTMQEAPRYGDTVAEVVAELRTRVAAAEAAGLKAGQIVVDPGFGFAKRVEDNLALVAHLEALSCLGHPVLVGASRKSTIGALTGAPVEERLPGTLALHTASLLKGARILRVHDVKEHAQALACAAALLEPRPPDPRAG